MNETYTLTFCDRAENHVGMATVGDMSENGFTYEELKKNYEFLSTYGFKCEFIELGYEAGVLVMRGVVDSLLEKKEGTNELFMEHKSLQPVWDKKAKMRGQVVNKHARHNLIFADFDQNPDYASGNGRIIDFKKVPLTEKIRINLPRLFGKKASQMLAEANYYYDIQKCYIGFHGDTERRRVIGVRLGGTFPLHFQWYKDSKKVGELVTINLNHGDVYVMSEKAVGFDWKKRSILTLRHAAGFPHVLKL